VPNIQGDVKKGISEEEGELYKTRKRGEVALAFGRGGGGGATQKSWEWPPHCPSAAGKLVPVQSKEGAPSHVTGGGLPRFWSPFLQKGQGRDRDLS